MPEKAAFCREQAAISREEALLLPVGDEIREGLERAEQAFLALARTFDESGVSIAQADIEEAAVLLKTFIVRARQVKSLNLAASGPDGSQHR